MRQVRVYKLHGGCVSCAFAYLDVIWNLRPGVYLILARQIKRMISSYVGENKLFEELLGCWAYGFRMFHLQLGSR